MLSRAKPSLENPELSIPNKAILNYCIIYAALCRFDDRFQAKYLAVGISNKWDADKNKATTLTMNNSLLLKSPTVLCCATNYGHK